MARRIEAPGIFVSKIKEAPRQAGISVKVYAEGKAIRLEDMYYPETNNLIREALLVASLAEATNAKAPSALAII